MLDFKDNSMEIEDRRDALRQLSKVELVTVEHATLGTLKARVLDISRHGLRMLMPVCIPCGDEIVVHPPQDTELLKLRANIVRQHLVMQEGERWFECGIKVSDAAEWRKHKWFLTLRDAKAACWPN